MRPRLITAMAIGALISAMLLLASGWLFPGIRSWAEILQAPGIIVMMLTWGPHGPVPFDSSFLVFALIWVINTIIYSLIAFGILSVFKISN